MSFEGLVLQASKSRCVILGRQRVLYRDRTLEYDGKLAHLSVSFFFSKEPVLQDGKIGIFYDLHVPAFLWTLAYLGTSLWLQGEALAFALLTLTLTLAEYRNKYHGLWTSPAAYYMVLDDLKFVVIQFS